MKKWWDVAPAKRLAKGLCLGLRHMHDTGLAHRDIKPDNILLQNIEGDPVIIDFGLCNANELQAGSPKYFAPEQTTGANGKLMEDKWYNVAGWDQRLFDSWALGCVLEECFEVFSPPPIVKDFIKRLKSVETSKRMTVQEALEHSWLKEEEQVLKESE